MIPSSLADSYSSSSSSSSSSFIIHRSSFIIHHSSIINHHGKNHQLVDLYLRFAHMWVIFKGSLGHNSMAHWCSIPVEQGDAGSNIFDISGRLLDLPHTVPQYKCLYDMSLSHRSSKYQNISYSKHHKTGAIICVCVYICVCFTNVSLSNHVHAGNKTVSSHGLMGKLRSFHRG